MIEVVQTEDQFLGSSELKDLNTSSEGASDSEDSADDPELQELRKKVH